MTDQPKPNVPHIGQIHESMGEIMKQCTHIAKGRKNQQQGYQFRGIDDVYASLHTILAENNVYMLTEIINSDSEERKTRSGSTIIYRILTIKFTFISAIDGSRESCVLIGEGMDSGDKAANKAMSVAQKYALLQAFLIPTEEKKDPENDSPEVSEITPDELVQKINEAKAEKHLNNIRQKYRKDFESFDNAGKNKVHDAIYQAKQRLGIK